MNDREKRVLVGMSGGIDSSATCIMLQEQGYEVVGVTMRTWDIASQFSTPGQEEPNFVLEARELAARLGIEHHVADVREEFKQVIVKYFIDEYMRGRTPNPCVMCNPLFKERILCEWADKTNCAHIATGHYCRMEDRNGNRYILTGDDSTKDQSYFLWKLPQEILKRMMFPLGGMTKVEVREYLASKGFEAKAKGGESMEICFIDKDYRDFLKEHSQLTVFTNGFQLASQLLHCPKVKTICTGGQLVPASHSFVGAHAQRFFEYHFADKLFFSSNSFSLEDGVTDSSETEAELKHQMILHARQIFFLADASKMEHTSAYKVCNASDIHVLVTNASMDVFPRNHPLPFQVRRVT